jgi:transposase InsO family protein
LGVIARQDSSQVGRRSRLKVMAEALQEAASLKYLELKVCAPVTSQTVLRMLQDLKAKGLLPLVWQTDNGKVYLSRDVQDFLAREKIIHLPSRFHTPTDNAGMEKAFRNLKEEARIASGLPWDQDAARRLDLARERLDQGRLKRSLGYRTSQNAQAALPHWSGMVSRDEIFQAVQKGLAAARARGGTARQVRTAEREAILGTLEAFGLVQRLRGPQDRPLAGRSKSAKPACPK